jgi:hypothetical protein
MNCFHNVARSIATGLLAIPFTALAALAAPAANTSADRSAILAMQGEYAVDFAFDETVLLQSGYERALAQRSGGDEVVIVVEDAPGRIVLQHILVDAKSGHVTKHWRQDWMYETKSRFDFSADQTWAVHALPAAATRGAWTQCVYEVSDAPRYCGSGRWEHSNGVSTWTSDAIWRPMPRREYTKRSDYNALQVVNRHTITPGGWTHEQFNTKVRRDPDGHQTELVREFGFNEYRKSADVDFTPAYAYWKTTSVYWTKVRAHWDRFLSQPPGLHMKTKVDGMAMIIPLFTQAGQVQAGKPVADADIAEVFSEWTEPAQATVSAAIP